MRTYISITALEHYYAYSVAKNQRIASTGS